MTKCSWVKRSLALVALVAGAGLFSVGCGGGAELPVDNTKPDGGGPVVTPDGSKPDNGGGIITIPDSSVNPDTYVPPGGTKCDGPPLIKCSSPAGDYCGKIGDGCGGTQDCGGCAAGKICTNSICVSPTSDGCAPLTCLQLGGQYCGKVGDGCGRQLDCGDCTTSGFTCGGGGIPNVCGAAPDSGVCPPTNCVLSNGRYCGTIGNNCGGSVDCGGCPAGETCGGAGIGNVCAKDNCTKAVCKPATGGQYCGTVGDGCGGQIDCGVCPINQTCGGAGVAGLCGAARPGTCTRRNAISRAARVPAKSATAAARSTAAAARTVTRGGAACRCLRLASTPGNASPRLLQRRRQLRGIVGTAWRPARLRRLSVGQTCGGAGLPMSAVTCPMAVARD